MLCFVVLTNILLLTSLIAILSNSLDKVGTLDTRVFGAGSKSALNLLPLKTSSVLSQCAEARDWLSECSNAEDHVIGHESCSRRVSLPVSTAREQDGCKGRDIDSVPDTRYLC